LFVSVHLLVLAIGQIILDDDISPSFQDNLTILTVKLKNNHGCVDIPSVFARSRFFKNRRRREIRSSAAWT
jgi:uncharacterized protein (DUF2141 family)